MSSGRLSADDANSTDGEGVWSPDIEQAFQEALLIYLPCGRRKHIIQEEGTASKMYGRNELIARHIKLRTGKTRSRKQVSSHIQVLARRKAKLEPNGLISHSNNESTNSNSTNSINSINSNNNNLPYSYQHHQIRASTSGTPSPSSGSSSSRPHSSQEQQQQQHQTNTFASHGENKEHQLSHHEHLALHPSYYDTWMDRPIVTQRIRLVEFSAFIEHCNPATVISGQSAAAQQPVACSKQLANHHSAAAHIAPDQLLHQQSSLIPHQQLYQHNQLQQHNRLHSGHHLQGQYNHLAHTPLLTNHQHHHHHQLTQSNSPQHLSLHQVKQDVSAHHQQHQNQSNVAATPAPALSTSPSLVDPRFVRHSYVQIDYRSSIERQTKRLERIHIGQIQDKFPEIGGSEGLFQRGPADAFFLVKFWADLNNDFKYNMEDQNSFFAFSSHFETLDPYKDITCSTKACSYGFQVVEKVDKIRATFNPENRCYSYAINRSPMCEFMIQFIKKLRQLPRASQMNSVLENFTVLQVITSDSTSEILLCLAYVFEVATHSLANPLETHPGPQYHVYKLTKD